MENDSTTMEMDEFHPIDTGSAPTPNEPSPRGHRDPTASLGFLEAMGQRVDRWLSSMGLRTGRDVAGLATMNHAPPKREQIHVAPPFQPMIADRIRNKLR